MDNTLDAWLRIRHTHGIGHHTARQLHQALGSAEAIIAASAAQLGTLGLSNTQIQALQNPDQARIDADKQWHQSSDTHHLLPLDHPLYPASVRSLDDCPSILYLIGDPELLALPQLAIVGSRNPTASGRDIATALAADLAARGLTITSGMALGIDAAAHQGALQHGGLTIAVTGTGPDRVYPAKHRDLAHQISQHGCIVTEFAVGIGPHASHFPRRNRIISALSLGVLVVEATPRSGSLITARLALEQGREVMAIPGPVQSPLSRGCHRLIRDGAKLVEGSDDVLEEIGPLLNAATVATPSQGEPLVHGARHDTGHDGVIHELTAASDAEQALLKALDHSPQALDTIAERANMNAADTASTLLLLELRGVACHHGGGRYGLARKKRVM